MEKENPINKIEKVNIFARFSFIGIQMTVVIVGFTFLGVYLDGFFELETPWMTIVCSIIGVFTGLYLVIKEVIALSKD